MWNVIFDLFFCPQCSIIYGTQNGIFRPENMALVMPVLQSGFAALTGLARTAVRWRS